MVTFNRSRSFNHNPSHRFIGVEVEIAYINNKNILDKTVNKWNGEVGYDGSVSGREGLFTDRKPTNLEIKTAPTNGDRFIKQMLELGKAFQESKATTNNTCGLHVHIDARDLKEKELDKVLALWYKIEKPMFSIVSPRRIKSNWCKPWKFKSFNPEKIKESIAKKYYGTNSCDDRDCDECNFKVKKSKSKFELVKEIKSGWLNLDRYASLNLNSLEKHGTLENRMHHGTTNVTNIMYWGMLNASMVDYAKENSLNKISSLRRGLDSLLAIAPNDKARDWIINRKENWLEKGKQRVEAE